MNLNLRQAILLKVQDKSTEEIAKLIEDSIGGDEKALPGLGVLFEVIWEHSKQDIQKQLSETLKNNLVQV
jgi:small acid-soluble spore protein I (minor)